MVMVQCVVAEDSHVIIKRICAETGMKVPETIGLAVRRLAKELGIPVTVDPKMRMFGLAQRNSVAAAERMMEAKVNSGVVTEKKSAAEDAPEEKKPEEAA